ncbi:MAG: hypothetical protein AAGF95_02910 [Chloroflexota bacterium]
MSFVLSTVVALVWLFLARWHLAIANDLGSPDKDTPFVIDEPTIAQAIFGRVDEGKPVEYYTFSTQQGTGVRAMLLIPAQSYANGLRATITLHGPELPIEGITPPLLDSPLTIAGREYVLVQSHVPPLPATGEYRLEVHQQEGSGAYCLCLGDREGGHADAAMRARIERVLSGEDMMAS